MTVITCGGQATIWAGMRFCLCCFVLCTGNILPVKLQREPSTSTMSTPPSPKDAQPPAACRCQSALVDTRTVQHIFEFAMGGCFQCQVVAVIIFSQRRYFFLTISFAFRLARNCLQNWSIEEPVRCCCRWTIYIAASSPIPRFRAIRSISLMTSSRNEYHCSSVRRPALQLCPHRLSKSRTAGCSCRPTVHSFQRPSTVLTARLILYCGSPAVGELASAAIGRLAGSARVVLW